MTVTLFRRGRVYYLDYRYRGKRYRSSTKTARKDLAEVARAQIEMRLFQGQLGVEAGPSGTCLKSLFLRYLNVSETTKARSTWQTETKQLRAWQQFFDVKRVDKSEDITPALISIWQSETSLSHRSQNNFIGLLKTVLNRAVDWGLISQNPIARLKKLKVPRKLRVFSDSDLTKLLRLANPEQRLIVLLGAYAGLRLGEIQNLRWRDIDLAKKSLSVRSDDEFTPKGKRGRVIPVHKKLLEALRRAVPKGQANGLVLPGYYNHARPRGKNWPSARFHELTIKAGVRGRLHDLRHTFGSRLVRAGVPLPEVRDLMGHSDIASTMIYVHVYPERYRSAIDRL